MSRRNVSAEHSCHMIIKVFMSEQDGRYYLNPKSKLQHSYHGKDDKDAYSMNETDLSDHHVDWIHEMYGQGLSNGTIASIMTGILQKEGQCGEFLTSTIKTITQKIEKEKEVLEGITADFSTAERTLKKLNAYVHNIFFVRSL